MQKIQVSKMIENEIAEPGDASTAIRSVEAETTRRFWVVEPVIDRDQTPAGEVFWFHRVIAWAVVLEQLEGFSPVSAVRPLALDSDLGQLEVSHGNVVELEDIPKGATYTFPEKIASRKLPDGLEMSLDLAVNEFFFPVG